MSDYMLSTCLTWESFYPVATSIQYVKDKDARQICNLDKTAFTPVRDLVSCRQYCVFSAKYNRPFALETTLQNNNRISSNESIFGDEKTVHPFVIFKVYWEPWLSEGSGIAVKVSKAVSPNWSAYWTWVVAGDDTSNFEVYITEFIPTARAKVEGNELIAHLYSGLRTRLTAAVMHMPVEQKKAVLTPSAQISDRLHLQNVSNFGAFEKAANQIIDECTKWYKNFSPNGAMLSKQNVLSSIIYGCSVLTTSGNIVSGIFSS